MLYSTVASDGGYIILYSIVACYIVCYRTTKSIFDTFKRKGTSTQYKYKPHEKITAAHANRIASPDHKAQGSGMAHTYINTHQF